MKKLLSILSGVLLLGGCFPDERNNFMVPDSLGLNALENVVEASVHTGACALGVVKSGKGQSAARIHVVQDEQVYLPLLTAYNTQKGTAYEAVQSNLFTVSNASLSFSEKEVSKTLTINWNPEQLAEYIGTNTNYVIPVLIESDTPDVKLRDDRKFGLIHLNRSAISVSQTSVPRVLEAKDVEAETEHQEDLVLDVTLTPAIQHLGVSFPVCIDNTLIESYNQAHSTTFVQAPEGLVTILDANALIAEGAKGGTFRIRLDKSVLLEGGKLPVFPDYLIPVRLQEENMTATLNGEAFPVKGLSVGNMVTYISITYYAAPVGFSISRVWGKYSTETASWNAYFGGTANTDRNFTMDDKYIYVPETSTTSATIWRIDLKHPETVSQAAAPATPTGYFKVTSARVMDPGTNSLNGGKPMLIVSNMVMTGCSDELKLYIYDQGTDTAPKEWTMQNTNLGRRLGDIFTTHGTFANGGFLFKDWDKFGNNGTILVWRTAFTSVPNYKQSPRNPTWNTIKDEGGRAAFYPYPGQEKPHYGIYTGTESAYYVAVKAGGDVYSWTEPEFDTTAASGYYKGAGDFNFFEYQGKRYIAYVKNVSSSNGRLYVLEGNLTDSWQDLLEGKRNVIFQAAIQANVQFSDGLAHDELDEPSPKASGHSGISCAVCEIDGAVYIMAGKQNVGLSLFRMSNN